MKLLRSLLLGTASSLVFGHLLAQEIAWVEQVTDPGGAIALMRDGSRLPIKPYTPLRAGDEIVVGEPAATLVIGSPDGRSVRVTAVQSPFRLTATRNAPTVSGNALRWVHGLFASKERSAGPALRSLSVRSAPEEALDLPYLGDQLFLLAGKRSLYISWSGGQPPYRLRLIRERDQQIVVNAGIPQMTQLITPETDLPVGDYRLEIGDQTGATYETRLQVLPGQAQPVFPDAGALGGLPADTARLILASWLASVEDGRWAMESMQQLHALRQSLPVAEEVLRRVSSGARLH